MVFTEFKNNASIVKLNVTGDASFNTGVSFNENVDIEEILQIQDRDVLEELTINKDGIVEINSGFTEFKNNASIVKLDVTGNASFNSDVSFTENVDIEGILQIQDRDVLGESTDINGRVEELESGGDKLNLTGTLDVTGKLVFLILYLLHNLTSKRTWLQVMVTLQ